MKIKIIERIEKENLDLVKFILEGVELELANAFRRIILTEVPTMAIEEVIFLQNDTVLFDEIIAHRLGLIPLVTDLKNYNLPDECDCEGKGCSLCRAEFILEKEAKDEEVIVYSRDLTPTDPKIRPVSDNIVIAKLGKNTALQLEAYAQLGRGKTHAKFQPVSAIGYKYYPKIVLNLDKFGSSEEDEEKRKEKAKQEMKEIVHKCPPKCFILNEKGEPELKEDYWKTCTLCGACERYSSPGAVRVMEEPNKYIFTIEGTGALPIKEILEYAVEIFLEKLDEFDEQLKKLKIKEKPIEIKR